jgi:hypothetical protein
MLGAYTMEKLCPGCVRNFDDFVDAILNDYLRQAETIRQGNLLRDPWRAVIHPFGTMFLPRT